MNNDNSIINKENNNNIKSQNKGSLMRKTKVELIDIILRKDNIEKTLRNNIKRLESQIEDYKNEYIALKQDYITLNNDYEDICDEKVTIECKLNTKNKIKNRIIKLLFIVYIISFIANIMLYMI